MMKYESLRHMDKIFALVAGVMAIMMTTSGLGQEILQGPAFTGGTTPQLQVFRLSWPSANRSSSCVSTSQETFFVVVGDDDQPFVFHTCGGRTPAPSFGQPPEEFPATLAREFSQYLTNHGVPCSVRQLEDDFSAYGSCEEVCWNNIIRLLTDSRAGTICGSPISYERRSLDEWLKTAGTPFREQLTTQQIQIKDTDRLHELFAAFRGVPTDRAPESAKLGKSPRLQVFSFEVPVQWDFQPFFVIAENARLPFIFHKTRQGEADLRDKSGAENRALAYTYASNFSNYLSNDAIPCTVEQLERDVGEMGGCGPKCWNKVVSRLTGPQGADKLCGRVIEYDPASLGTWLQTKGTGYSQRLRASIVDEDLLHETFVAFWAEKTQPVISRAPEPVVPRTPEPVLPRTPEPPIVSGEPPIVSGEPPIVSGEPPIVSGEPPGWFETILTFQRLTVWEILVMIAILLLALSIFLPSWPRSVFSWASTKANLGRKSEQSRKGVERGEDLREDRTLVVRAEIRKVFKSLQYMKNQMMKMQNQMMKMQKQIFSPSSQSQGRIDINQFFLNVNKHLSSICEYTSIYQKDIEDMEEVWRQISNFATRYNFRDQHRPDALASITSLILQWAEDEHQQHEEEKHRASEYKSETAQVNNIVMDFAREHNFLSENQHERSLRENITHLLRWAEERDSDYSGALQFLLSSRGMRDTKTNTKMFDQAKALLDLSPKVMEYQEVIREINHALERVVSDYASDERMRRATEMLGIDQLLKDLKNIKFSPPDLKKSLEQTKVRLTGGNSELELDADDVLWGWIDYTSWSFIGAVFIAAERTRVYLLEIWPDSEAIQQLHITLAYLTRRLRAFIRIFDVTPTPIVFLASCYEGENFPLADRESPFVTNDEILPYFQQQMEGGVLEGRIVDVLQWGYRREGTDVLVKSPDKKNIVHNTIKRRFEEAVQKKQIKPAEMGDSYRV